MQRLRHLPQGREHRVPTVMKNLSAKEAETTALAISVIWLLAVQLLAVLAWDAGMLTRQSALVHWLVVGVLPPAMALWRMQPAEASDR